MVLYIYDKSKPNESLGRKAFEANVKNDAGRVARKGEFKTRGDSNRVFVYILLEQAVEAASAIWKKN